MGMILPTSIMDKMKRGEPLNEDDIAYIGMMREHTARYALPLPMLFGMTLGIIGLLVFMTVETMGGM